MSVEVFTTLIYGKELEHGTVNGQHETELNSLKDKHFKKHCHNTNHYSNNDSCYGNV